LIHVFEHWKVIVMAQRANTAFENQLKHETDAMVRGIAAARAGEGEQCSAA
jgi:hypothetical protein